MQAGLLVPVRMQRFTLANATVVVLSIVTHLDLPRDVGRSGISLNSYVGRVCIGEAEYRWSLYSTIKAGKKNTHAISLQQVIPGSKIRSTGVFVSGFLPAAAVLHLMTECYLRITQGVKSWNRIPTTGFPTLLRTTINLYLQERTLSNQGN